jgi:hypothetical protein
MADDFIINRDNKFDIQLSAAKIREQRLGELLAGGKIELKAETWQWRRTGNICLEFRQNGRPSGIAVSEADVWIHRLNDDGGRPLVSLMFPLERVKALARWAYRRDGKRLGGGDRGEFDNVVVSLRDFVEWLMAEGPDEK